MTFVFDIDDTICDTNGFSKEYIEKFFKENNWPFKQIANETRYAEAKFDWDSNTANQWYKVHGEEMMMLFPCKEYAVEFINSLYNAGHRIVLATARSNDWHTNPVAITKIWLSKNKIKYSKLYIGREDKQLICEMENANFFIDDDLKITGNVAKHFSNKNNKCQAILMTSEYNQNQKEAEGVKRIKDFYDLAEVLKEYGVTLNNDLKV